MTEIVKNRKDRTELTEKTERPPLAKPIGKIYLEVAFGTMENFCSEIMSFEVVDLKSPYHALDRKSVV